ncbi:MAG: hypothetical protein M1826_006514 [Phylliscum demangeonii]|nr:MAG: hypothetical protein M1826_006514 [Phylliscum demangeonii]
MPEPSKPKTKPGRVLHPSLPKDAVKVPAKEQRVTRARAKSTQQISGLSKAIDGKTGPDLSNAGKTKGSKNPDAPTKSTRAVEASKKAPRKTVLKTKGSKNPDAPTKSTPAVEASQKAPGKTVLKTKGKPARNDHALSGPASPADDAPAEAAMSDGEGSEEEDDQTAALLRGFQSSESEESSDDEGDAQIRSVPEIPSPHKLTDDLVRAKGKGDSERGVIYVGRVPHGFYEHQMRAYFSQFGEVTRLRLSRNKKTGRSKHYAFIEFASSDVAQIAADTMHSYLLFGHIMKCHVLAKEQMHERLWNGANRRFKAVPRNKLQGQQLAAAKTPEQWAKKITAEAKRRHKSRMTLKEKIGYEYDLPTLTTVDQVVPENSVGKKASKVDVTERDVAETDGGVESDGAPGPPLTSQATALLLEKRTTDRPAIRKAMDELRQKVVALAPPGQKTKLGKAPAAAAAKSSKVEKEKKARKASGKS